jgi:hypothetical protein
MACPYGWIDWKQSEAKQIILHDLETGILPVDATELLAAEKAWEIA